MKELFKAFMERAIHDDEMEKAQELAKDFPVEIALPQAMGFQAGYNAALEEILADEEIGFLIDKFNELPLVSITTTNIAKYFNKACLIYHAKKCAECLDSCARAREHCEDRESPHA